MKNVRVVLIATIALVAQLVVLAPHAAVGAQPPLDNGGGYTTYPDPNTNTGIAGQNALGEIAAVPALDSLANIAAAFNRARGIENADIGGEPVAQVMPMNLAFPADYASFSPSQKGLFLINAERTARGLLPFEGVHADLIWVGQNWTRGLAVNGTFNHNNNVIAEVVAACTGCAGTIVSDAENLYQRNASAWPTPAVLDEFGVERAIYGWMYYDRDSGGTQTDQRWGHRHALLWNNMTNDHGPATSEGFMSIGIWKVATSSPGGFAGESEVVTFNAIDTNATWPGPVMPAPACDASWPDFDRDGSSDRSVFRPAVGGWYVSGQPTAFLGLTGDIPVPCNYNGDGATERAVFRPSTGGWHVAGQTIQYLGLPGDIPVPGDYDGDGDAERAVFRPSSGAWYVAGQPTQYLGVNGDIPVPGDYDGNGTTDPAVFRPTTGAWHVAGQPTQYLGVNGDIPVPADFDGNGTTERAVYRPIYGAWYVQGQPTQYLGLNTDKPVPVDYDGDNAAERGVYRPAYGGWYVEGITTEFYGLGTDTPLPIAPGVHQHFFP